MSHADVFNDIYRRNAWGAGSGTGSLPHLSRPYIRFLQNFMRANRIRSVVDVGCGDWQFSRMIDWTGIDYTGIDVSSVVLTLTRAFARSGIAFLEMDAIGGDIPAADLLVAKDVLQHWPNADVENFLKVLPRFKYALITNGFPTNRPEPINSDITPGHWRPIDLSRPPFALCGTYVFWYRSDEPKFVFLWQNPVWLEKP